MVTDTSMGDAVSPTVTEEPNKWVLDSSHRCDRCQAQGYYMMTLPNGLDLIMCVHHFREHETKLRPIALMIIDESERAK